MEKLEVARHQLGTALALYLDGKDQISIRTLACGGWEIAEAFAELKGEVLFRSFKMEEVPGLGAKDFKDLRNKQWNPLKHATRHNGKLRDDSEILADMHPEDTRDMLAGGWFDYFRAAGTLPIEASVFSDWYAARAIAKAAPDVNSELIAHFTRLFPGLAAMPQEQQHVQLLQAIAGAKANPKVRANPIIDPRPLILSG